MKSRFLLSILTLLSFLVPTSRGEKIGPFVQDQIHSYANVRFSVPLPNGQVLILGDFESIGGVAQSRVARLNPDGNVDRSWHPLVTADIDKLVVSGDEVYFFGGAAERLTRTTLSGDGQIDPDWSIPLSALSNGYQFPIDVAVEGGFVYLLTSEFPNAFTNPQETEQFFLRRYFRTGTGQMEASWTSKKLHVGTGVFGAGRLLVDARHVYVAHQIYDDVQPRPTLLERFSVAGKGVRDTRWKITLPAGGQLSDLAQDEKYIYLVGDSLPARRASPAHVARFSKATPLPDRKWPTDNVAFNETVSNVAVSGGRAYFLGTFSVVGVPTGPENPNGLDSVDHPLDDSYSALSATGDAIYLSGLATATARPLLRLAAGDGLADDSFQPHLYRSGTVRQVLRLPNGVTFVCGQFDAVEDSPIKNLARFEADGHVNPLWSLRTDLFSTNPAASIEQIRATGDALYGRLSSSAGPPFFKVSIATPARLDTTWDPAAKLQAAGSSLSSTMHYGFSDTDLYVGTEVVRQNPFRVDEEIFRFLFPATGVPTQRSRRPRSQASLGTPSTFIRASFTSRRQT